MAKLVEQSFQEFHGGIELGPPIGLGALHPSGIKTINELKVGEESGWICLKLSFNK
jgi:hypothetical protein